MVSRGICVCLFGALSAIALWSQSVNTEIVGTVSDSSAAVIADASVTITEPLTRTVHNVQSGAGAYEVRYRAVASSERAPGGTPR